MLPKTSLPPIPHGMQTRIANELGCSQAAVWKWWSTGIVPAERVLDVERITGISRHVIRLDVYPIEPPPSLADSGPTWIGPTKTLTRFRRAKSPCGPLVQPGWVSPYRLNSSPEELARAGKTARVFSGRKRTCNQKD